MNKIIGTLKIVAAKDNTQLLAAPVASAIGGVDDYIGVAEINPELSDTAVFCEQYEVPLTQVANCVVLEAKRADKKWFAACVILGNTRADVNGLARRALGARRVSFAPMEQAVQETGMEYGAITPVGLPDDWPILVDEAVADSEQVIIGSGIRKSKLAVSGQFIASLQSAEVLASLGN